MLLDSLKDINSTADLFAYICKIEEELETVKKQRDLLLIDNDSLINKVNQLEKAYAEVLHTLEFSENKMTPKREPADN